MDTQYLVVVCLHLSLLFYVIGGSKIPAIFSFGDSIFDAGNNHYIKNCSDQADFPPYGSAFFHHATGRFTNGRTVPDFISEFLRIPLQKPYLEAEMEFVKGNIKNYPSNGINFASAGSGILSSTNNYSAIIPLWLQLQQFQALVEQNRIDTKTVQESFYLLESGSNDIVAYFNPFVTITLTEDDYIQSMLTEVENFVDTLYKLGARRIVLFALGPVGCIPARAMLPGAPITKCYGKLNKVVKSYNTRLEELVKTFPVKYPDAIGVFGAVYKIVQNFRADPKYYGFEDVDSACCGYGTLGGELQCGTEGYTLCKNPNHYLFWDLFHPTEHAYKLISKELWAGGRTRIRPFNLKKLANITLPQI